MLFRANTVGEASCFWVLLLCTSSKIVVRISENPGLCSNDLCQPLQFLGHGPHGVLKPGEKSRNPLHYRGTHRFPLQGPWVGRNANANETHVHIYLVNPASGLT